MSINENEKDLAQVFEVPKLPFLNDKPESSILIKVELMFVKCTKTCHENLNLDKQYKLAELNSDLSNFLLDQHLKPLGLNYKVESSQIDENNLYKLKWLKILNFCFVSLDLLFNCGWTSMFSYFKSFKNNLVESISLNLFI